MIVGSNVCFGSGVQCYLLEGIQTIPKQPQTPVGIVRRLVAHVRRLVGHVRRFVLPSPGSEVTAPLQAQKNLSNRTKGPHRQITRRL